jgi:hypothetical protein
VSSFKTRYVQNTVHSERNKLTLNSKKRNKSDLDFVNKASGQGKPQPRSQGFRMRTRLVWSGQFCILIG